ncbi:MAG TPA: rod shape-determining protein RodA [Hyphomicrobiales bacterium]|nr:rod shape-determining protein RodA [Hyphomicrobiales bacterium]
MALILDFSRQGSSVGAGLGRKRSIWSRLHVDLPLLCVLVVVLGFGLLVLYSATDGSVTELRRQAVFIGLAFVVMLVVAQIQLRWFRLAAPWLFLGGVGLLVLVLLMGDIAKGAQRWLDFPGLPRFQPAEIMKTVVPLTVAAFLSRYSLPPRFWQIAVALLVIIVPAALTAMQPDLGTALLIVGSGLFVILLAGIRWKHVFSAVMLGLLAIPALWVFYLQDYQKQRIHTFLDPESEPLGAGWNIIQSKTAIGAGGLYGKGWLNGVQSRLDFLPEGQTDFIVAVLAEEFGLIGVLFLLTLYLAIIGRCLYIGAMAQDTFSRLLAGSLALTFFVYVFVNIGMVSGILPVVGVPLPLVSLGGTSIVSLMLGFGILMSIHTHKSKLAIY